MSESLQTTLRSSEDKPSHPKPIVIKNRAIGFKATYAYTAKLDAPGCAVWVDCMSCDLTIGFAENLSNEQFVQEAAACGWVVEPHKRVLCPECKIANMI